jgi:hypothetical protein
LNDTISLIDDDPDPVTLVEILFIRLLSPDAGSGHPSTNGFPGTPAEMFGFGLGQAAIASPLIASRNRIPEIKHLISNVHKGY